MIHPYRIAPARHVPASRSWWRNAWRLYRVQRAWQAHRWPRFLGTMVAAFAVWQAMARAWRLLGWIANESPAGWALAFAIAVLSWPLADLLLGYLRLRRVRRALRNGDIGRLLDGTAAEHALRGATVTATTFPAIAAYRELTRTGDVAAFAARRDLDPVTVEYTLQAMDDAEAMMDAARRARDAAEEVSEMLRERAQKGRTW